MDHQTIKEFRKLLRRFERELFMQNNDACCGGVTLAQCHTLLEIESKRKESLTELARTLGLDKSTISRTIDGLVTNGLVSRTIPVENRRMATLQLTDEGRQICRSINRTNDEYFKETLSVLNDDEKATLNHLLDRVVNRMVQLRTQRE